MSSISLEVRFGKFFGFSQLTGTLWPDFLSFHASHVHCSMFPGKSAGERRRREENKPSSSVKISILLSLENTGSLTISQ